MRVVLDTNVLISGLFRQDSPPGELLDLWTENAFRLVTSVYQIDELRRALGYKRLRSLNPELVAALLANMDAKADVLAGLPAIHRSADPKDNPILATAIAGDADLLVSGDKSHLLSLGQIEGIPIVTPREAVRRLRDQGM